MLNFLLSFLKVFNTRPIWSNYGQDSKRNQSALKRRVCETGHDYFAESPLFFSSKRDKGKYLRTNSDGDSNH